MSQELSDVDRISWACSAQNPKLLPPPRNTAADKKAKREKVKQDMNATFFKDK